MAIEKTTGRLVGVLTSTRSPDGLTVLFGSLAIHRGYRRRGLAKKLVLCAVEDRARFDGYFLSYFAYVRVRRQLNHGSYLAFKAAGFFATRPVLKKRDALGPRAAHWDEETARLLVITKNPGAMSTAEFDALSPEMV